MRTGPVLMGNVSLQEGRREGGRKGACVCVIMHVWLTLALAHFLLTLFFPPSLPTLPQIDSSKQGEEVFSEARSLLFKTVRVRRVYDKDANALIYVSYSTRFSNKDDDNKSRFKSSICAIPLDQEAAQQTK